MKNPTKEQVQIVIDTLTKARDMVIAEGYERAPVDMLETEVHSCGTPMCHAGYYSLVKERDNFVQGAVLLSRDLGFASVDSLENWAENNEEIWGNQYGAGMFASARAFNFERGLEVKDLQVIIDHWKGVQTRL